MYTFERLTRQFVHALVALKRFLAVVGSAAGAERDMSGSSVTD